MLKAKLVIVGGDAKAGEINLELPTTIGRGKEADLTIPHALVSRTHSKLFEQDGQLWVEDLGSLNGTFVDNTRIESEQVIEPNQLLTLGNITFRAVYLIDESARKTLPSTLLPDSFQTVKIDPVVVPQATSKSTLVSDDNIGAVPTAQTIAPTEDTEPAPVFEEAPGPRSAISEIDSFDPDEIGSLDSMLEKNKPQDSQESKPVPPSAGLPKKRPAKQTSNKPVLRASAPQIKPSKVQQTRPEKVAIDLGTNDIAAHAPVSSVDLNLDLPDNVEAAPVSFIGQLQTDEVESPSLVDDFQIDIGSDDKSNADVDDVRFDSFLKKLPK